MSSGFPEDKEIAHLMGLLNEIANIVEDDAATPDGQLERIRAVLELDNPAGTKRNKKSR